VKAGESVRIVDKRGMQPVVHQSCLYEIEAFFWNRKTIKLKFSLPNDE
jgi:hypothetical protein